ncbi:MAG: phosphate regulon sensor histidine kinase PhoR [Proteobacteria bacterium]|nr:phosphate regulon sensor histidine kinase PhoR [Burkholderiales bacterium]
MVPDSGSATEGARVRGFWRRPLAWLAVWLALTGAAAAVFGPVPALLALLVWLLFQHWRQLSHLASLVRWLDNPSDKPIPYGSGMWEEAFSYLARLVRWQRQSEAGLRSALERFQSATSAMNEAVILLDELDRIEWCNPSAEHYFEVDSQRDVGRQLTYIVRQPQFVEYLLAQNFAEPFVLRGARGGETTLSVQLVPYGNRQKLVISRDITRWERLEAMRRDLVANVSHELRTPITVLAGFLETLNDQPVPDVQLRQRAMELMTQQTSRMQNLVEDLLTLSRLENSRGPAAEQPVDAPRLVQTLHHDALALSKRRHQITVEVDADLWLVGAESELRSVFLNFITNAIRYTPAKGRIAIGWRASDDGGAVFSVSDTGIGIAPEHIPRLTERFYRVDRSRSRETGGTGLGLAIVKYALSHHQARLEIESEPGQGSTFSAIFPPRRICRAPVATVAA